MNRKKGELDLLFGEWLIEKEAQFQDNMFYGNVYSYSGMRNIKYSTMKEMYNEFISQLSRKDCPAKLICSCHNKDNDGFCIMNKNYKNFIKSQPVSTK